MPSLYTPHYRSRDFSRYPIASSKTVLKNGAPYEHVEYNLVEVDGWEAMHHNAYPIKRGLRPKPGKDVLHEKYKVEGSQTLPPWIEVGQGGTYSATTTSNWNAFPPVNQFQSSVRAFWPVISDDRWGSMCRDAIMDWSPQIPEETNLFNFSWELREWASLIPRFTGNLFKDVSGGHLQQSFGWEPFLADLRKLYNLVENVRSKIQHLRETWGKATRLSFERRNIHLIPAILGTDRITDLLVGHLDFYRADFRVNGTLYHTLEGLDTAEGELRAFVVALGLTNPVKAFWNAIPFSFVVDWLTKIGDRFFSSGVQPFKGDWVVTGASCSLKEVMTVSIHRDVQYYPNEVIPMGLIHGERYTRLCRLPVELGSFNLLELSTQQQTLLAAIVIGAL